MITLKALLTTEQFRITKQKRIKQLNSGDFYSIYDNGLEPNVLLYLINSESMQLEKEVTYDN